MMSDHHTITVNLVSPLKYLAFQVFQEIPAPAVDWDGGDIRRGCYANGLPGRQEALLW